MAYTKVDAYYLENYPVKFQEVACFNVVDYNSGTKLAEIKNVMTDDTVTVYTGDSTITPVEGQDYIIGIQFKLQEVSATDYPKANLLQPTNYKSTLLTYGV